VPLAVVSLTVSKYLTITCIDTDEEGVGIVTARITRIVEASRYEPVAICRNLYGVADEVVAAWCHGVYRRSREQQRCGKIV